MWAGVCHSVPQDDARLLVRAGMAEPSRKASGQFDGLVGASTKYSTPSEALRALTNGRSKPRAATDGHGSFWDPPKRAAPAPAQQAAEPRRRRFR